MPEETAPARPTAVCGSGHTYFTDGRYALNRHRDRTCTRCSQTYQKCSNHSSACQGSRSHTEDPSATPTPSPPTETPSSPPSETPTPSPPENSDNNNENEEEEEVPAAPPAPPISYHPCGVHATTVSGDHSLQASCSTDSTCIATSFYQCQHSSHTYPAVTTRPCGHPTTRGGSHSWVSAGKCPYRNSEGDRCKNTSGYYRCKPHTHEYPKWETCSSGHRYNAESDSAVKRHRVRTCRFSECGQTWQVCVNGWDAPICEKPYRKRNGLRCWEP